MSEKTYNLSELCKAAVFQLDNFCEVNELKDLVKADLICITCSSNQIYEARRGYYEFDSRFIYQAVISGRRIATIGLKEAVPTSVGDLAILEVIDQKPDNSQTDRLTHLAIVPTGISYEDLLAKLKENGAHLEDKSRGDGYTATDVVLPTDFRIRIEKETLIDRIKGGEFR